MKKTLMLIIAAMLVLSLFAVGCEPQSTTTASGNTTATTTSAKTTTTTTSGSEEPGEYTGVAPIFEEPFEITWLAYNTGVATAGDDYEKMAWIQEINKRANVNIKMDLLPSGTYADSVTPRLAAGQDLPDVFLLPRRDTDMSLANSGLMYELTDFYDKYAFNLNWRFDSNPTLKSQLTTPDGKVFLLPIINMSKDYIPALFVNLPWLDAISAEIPKTVDEFYDLLKRFQNDDPNGNNQSDEIPFATTGTGYFKMLGSMWGLNLAHGWYANDQGVVEFSYASDRYKEFLEFCHKLYEEKLLDNEFASLTTDQLYTNIANNLVGATFHYPNFATPFARQVNPDWDPYTDDPILMPILPLKGTQGHQFYNGNDPFAGGFAINGKTDPERAKKIFWFMDYLFSEEANNLMYYGIEGVDHDVVDGKIVPRLDVIGQVDYSARSGGNFGGYPRILLGEHRDKTQPPAIGEYNALAHDYIKLPILWTYNQPDEVEITQTYSTDLSTYFNEMMLGFIIGTNDLSQFDSYLAQLKALGADEMTQMYQAIYDRTQG